MTLIPIQLGFHSALQTRQAWVMAVHQNRGKRLLSYGRFSHVARKAGHFGWDLLRFGLITHDRYRDIYAATQCCRDRGHSSAKLSRNPPALMVAFVLEEFLSFECNVV